MGRKRELGSVFGGSHGTCLRPVWVWVDGEVAIWRERLGGNELDHMAGLVANGPRVACEAHWNEFSGSKLALRNSTSWQCGRANGATGYHFIL